VVVIIFSPFGGANSYFWKRYKCKNFNSWTFRGGGQIEDFFQIFIFAEASKGVRSEAFGLSIAPMDKLQNLV